MPRRKQHVQEMEKYEVRVPSSMTRVTLGPMFGDWEAQRSAAGFGPSCQQQWIKHLLEVHSLACNGQGCARMYEGGHAQGTPVSRTRGRPKGSTSPRTSGSPRPRGRPRKGSPHRNTSMYVRSVKMEQEEDEEEDDEEEAKKESTSDSESTSGSTNGEAEGKEQCGDDKQQVASSSDSTENDAQADNQEATGLEDEGEENNTASQDPEQEQGENHENEQTITFEQVDDSQLVEKTSEDASATQLEQQTNLYSRLHELYPTDIQNNMPIDLTTRILGYAFPNIHTPPSSPSTTSSSNKSTLPPTAEYKEVRLRRGNGYYIKEYIYIKNRDCNGKIFLRCQFRASCRARAVVLIDTGRVIVTQGRHTHPPPHPQMIRFGPHIKDISSTWANRVAKKEAAHAKSNVEHHRKQIIIAKHSKKSSNESPAVVTQTVTQQTIQQSIPIATAASPVVSIPPSPVVPVAAYKFTPQFTTTQGNTITAANNIINVQQPAAVDNGGTTASKVNSGMPLIVKSWSLLKGNQPNNIITQPLNVLQQAKTCLLLQSNPPNSNPVAGLINVASQPQVSIAYNFNTGNIISQPLTTFTQSPLMQRVVVSQNIDQIDQNAANLSVKDNQTMVEQAVTSDAVKSATITTIQPQPTSPLPVQLVAAVQPSVPENGGHYEQSEQQEQLTTAENGATLDLRVVSNPEEKAKNGKKRANIFSITEKLMKQKQQRLSEDQ